MDENTQAKFDEKVKELLDDSQKEEIKKDLAIQKAIDLVTEAAVEA